MVVSGAGIISEFLIALARESRNKDVKMIFAPIFKLPPIVFGPIGGSATI